MKNVLSIIILLFPIIVFGQMSFDEIKEKTIELRERFVNKEVLKEKIKEQTKKYYDKNLKQGSGKDTGGIAVTLAFLYADVGGSDSVFHYLEINRKLNRSSSPLSNASFIKIFDDPRFEVYLDSCYSNFKGTNNLQLRLYQNTKLVREYSRLGILQSAINELYKFSEGDYLGLREELKKLSTEFENYQTWRFKEFVRLNGFPTYSEHGYNVPNLLFMHFRNSSMETLIDNVGELEKLALKKEADGEFISVLVDEKLINEGKKQKYGTIYVYLYNNKKYKPFPIENEKEVNELRKKIGLKKTIEEYYNELNNIYQNNFNNGGF